MTEIQNKSVDVKRRQKKLRLIVETNEKEFEREGDELRGEAIELKKIFSSVIEKTK